MTTAEPVYHYQGQDDIRALQKMLSEENKNGAGWTDMPVKQILRTHPGSNAQYQYIVQVNVGKIEDKYVREIRQKVYRCLKECGHDPTLSKEYTKHASRALVALLKPDFKTMNYYLEVLRGDIEAPMVTGYIEEVRRVTKAIIESVIKPAIEKGMIEDTKMQE